MVVVVVAEGLSEELRIKEQVVMAEESYVICYEICTARCQWEFS